MSVPQNKSELLAEIDKTFNKLIGYLDIIPPALAADKSMAGHAKDAMQGSGRKSVI